jgi:biopolymer transport protein ExbD
MRRFSQRSALVTLSEINITPLLDLAFVLLIIFVITTPLLTQSVELKLPVGGQPDQKVDKRDIRTVEIDSQGRYFLERRPMNLAALEQNLAADYQYNRNLVVYIRADRRSPLEYFAALTDCCQRHGITRYSLRYDPPKPNR